METFRYEDIIDLPHHVSQRRTPMSRLDRAAQFSPFAALTGFDGAIAETGRLTDREAELTEGSLAFLDEKLRLVQAAIHTRPEVSVTFFLPDARKDGGSYETHTGRVKKVDTYERTLVFTDGQIIPLERIYGLELMEPGIQAEK